MAKKLKSLGRRRDEAEQHLMPSPAGRATWREVRFKGVVRDPEAWIRDARMLMATAHVIKAPWVCAMQEVYHDRRSNPADPIPLMEIGPVYCMVAGFAIEAIAKAIVAGSLQLVVAHTLPRELTGHDVVRVLERVPGAVTLSEAERDVLRMLGGFTVWGGRYPTSIEATDMGMGKWADVADIPSIEALFTRLEKIAVATVKPTP